MVRVEEVKQEVLETNEDMKDEILTLRETKKTIENPNLDSDEKIYEQELIPDFNN
jgi:predicted phage-related endonuclease